MATEPSVASELMALEGPMLEAWVLAWATTRSNGDTGARMHSEVPNGVADHSCTSADSRSYTMMPCDSPRASRSGDGKLDI
jgi:hypothetical protein